MGFNIDKGCRITRCKSVAQAMPMPNEVAQWLKAMLKRHDTNGDGQLSKLELRNAFNSLGSMLPAWRAARALHHADANRDGYINEEELDELVNYILSLGYSIK